jgi:hypoxanthine phosphoribosyltransferase
MADPAELITEATTKIKPTHETWMSIEQAAKKVGGLIAAHTQNTGEVFERAVILPPGGHFLALMTRDFTGIKNITDILYMGATRDARDPTGFSYGQMPARKDVEGRKLLLFGDASCTGRLMMRAKEILLEDDAEFVRTALLHFRSSLAVDGFEPDFYAEPAGNVITYPWGKSGENGVRAGIAIANAAEIAAVQAGQPLHAPPEGFL